MYELLPLSANIQKHSFPQKTLLFNQFHHFNGQDALMADTKNRKKTHIKQYFILCPCSYNSIPKYAVIKLPPFHIENWTKLNNLYLRFWSNLSIYLYCCL